MAANHELIRRNRQTAIQAILAEIESRAQSHTDPLTRLPNRRGLEGEYERLTAAGTEPVLLYLDLDGFKGVNDRLGHGIGDMLLVEVGARLREICGPRHHVCRLGGDEFLVLADLPDSDAVRTLGAQLVAGLSRPYQLGPSTLARVGVSIGAAPSQPKQSLVALMETADRALYAAKAAGKGRCRLAEDPLPAAEPATAMPAA